LWRALEKPVNCLVDSVDLDLLNEAEGFSLVQPNISLTFSRTC